ncbi:hypothetical protein AAFN85_05235 [Mucilaginibacter sp. CAU 1740]|uniref:hypothetical protein n=1 Tax=Mucilaginibacter sp. CAU 1740 TaxID=3140365 RepID=UPI00325BA327
MDLNQIYPLIVPRSYYSEGSWELPHQQFYNKQFLLTWVFFTGSGVMSYITKEQFVVLNENHSGWQQTSFENLRHSITDKENFFTHHATGSDGKTIIFLAFVHGDGIGSSRILLSNELSNIFPNGYQVALPDRSVGIVVPNGINLQEMKEVKQMTNDMYKKATTPMSGQVYNSEWFSLPEKWLMPVDKDFASALINQSRETIGK